MKNFLVLKIYYIFKIIMKNLTAVKRWKPVCMDLRLTPTTLNDPRVNNIKSFKDLTALFLLRFWGQESITEKISNDVDLEIETIRIDDHLMRL